MRWFWIDRFIEFESGRRAKAIKNISLAEDYLHDHFPGYPTMPKSLIIEGVAQTGGLLVGEVHHFRENVVLAKLPRASFFCEAAPGDTLIYTATIEQMGDDGAVVTATSYKGDQLQAELEIVFAHLNGGLQAKTLFEPRDYLKMMRMLCAYQIGRAADGSPLTEPPELLEAAAVND